MLFPSLLSFMFCCLFELLDFAVSLLPVYGTDAVLMSCSTSESLNPSK